jgi:competence protein ComFA
MDENLYDRLETVYAAWTRTGEVAGVWAAGEPEAAAAWAAGAGLASLRALTYPLPAALAEEVAGTLRGRVARRGGRRDSQALVALAGRELRRRGLPWRFRLAEQGVTGEGLPLPEGREAVRAALTGRRLFAGEVLRFAGGAGPLFPEAVGRALTFLRLAGEVGSEAAVARDEGGRWRCGRCASTRISLVPCANCGDPACPFCPDCALLGEARACRRLYFRPDHRPCPPLSRPTPGADDCLPFTAAQRRAAEALLAWLHDPRAPVEALLWAVCGAGKTLVARPALEQALAAGWRVLYASPRRQVIRQVAADLPGEGLTLSTTHQALRYQEAFDLVLLDEPDAYPYRGNETLQAGMKRAARPGARWLYLTATPEPQLIARVEAGAVRRILLPQRFHGHPVPVPVLLTPRTAGAEGGCPQGITALAAELIQNRLTKGRRRFLVFAPTVALCHQSGAELARRLPEPVGAVDAGSPGREETIAAFRQGELRVLVSTSVLERGVTFASVEVVVLGADHPLFDRVSLLQMAGRAGRTSEDPAGHVWFLAETVSPEMAAARQWSEALNEAAG